MELFCIKQWLRKHYILYDIARFICFKQSRVNAVSRCLVRFPVLHCDYVIKHCEFDGLGTIYPRTVPHDLKNPLLFNEKLLWLKYYNYNKNSLCAQCYDKYTVRKYVQSCGCEQYLTKLYGIWDSFEDIPWNKLPDEYVLKLTNGSGGAKNHVFKHVADKINVADIRERLLLSAREQQRAFKATGALFATHMPQKYICEELLSPEDGYQHPTDYKIYCFNGEPRFLLMIWDRKESSSQKAFLRLDDSSPNRFVNQPDFFDTAQPIKLESSICYEEMLDLCRKLSKPFPFVRVDLYLIKDRLFFGELTFSLANFALYHVFDRNKNINNAALIEMGNLLNLSIDKACTH